MARQGRGEEKMVRGVFIFEFGDNEVLQLPCFSGVIN